MINSYYGNIERSKPEIVAQVLEGYEGMLWSVNRPCSSDTFRLAINLKFTAVLQIPAVVPTLAREISVIEDEVRCKGVRATKTGACIDPLLEMNIFEYFQLCQQSIWSFWSLYLLMEPPVFAVHWCHGSALEKVSTFGTSSPSWALQRATEEKLCPDAFVELMGWCGNAPVDRKPTLYRAIPCCTESCRDFVMLCLMVFNACGVWEGRQEGHAFSPSLPWAEHALVLDLQIIIMTDCDNKKSHENRSCKEVLD